MIHLLRNITLKKFAFFFGTLSLRPVLPSGYSLKIFIPHGHLFFSLFLFQLLIISYHWLHLLLRLLQSPSSLFCFTSISLLNRQAPIYTPLFPLTNPLTPLKVTVSVLHNSHAISCICLDSLSTYGKPLSMKSNASSYIIVGDIRRISLPAPLFCEL